MSNDLEKELEQVLGTNKETEGQVSPDVNEGTPAQAAPEEAPEESKIPDKFKGKSIEDIADAYRNLEKQYGAKANEVGELRKLQDQLLNLELNPNQKVQESEPDVSLEFDDLLENPEGSVQKVLENSPKFKEMEQRFQQQELKQAQKGFEDKHPDWQEIVQSESFSNWITESPVRQKMFREADVNFDYEVGNELFDLYKAVNATANDTSSQARESQLKDAAMVSGTSGEVGAKIYRSADLVRLRMEDQDKFDALQPEILKAYAEGRVK